MRYSAPTIFDASDFSRQRVILTTDSLGGPKSTLDLSVDLNPSLLVVSRDSGDIQQASWKILSMTLRGVQDARVKVSYWRAAAEKAHLDLCMGDKIR